jgi:ABC-type antimicrobial peptide transport system permease subunit
VAIGATRARIFAMVYRRVGGMLAAGIVAGACAAWAARRLLGTVVTLQPEHDVFALLGLAGIFVAVALLAALLPARRAATVDPMTSLRSE